MHLPPPKTPAAAARAAVSPSRPKRPNKPLSAAAPPSFALALSAFKAVSGGNKRKKTSRPRERREGRAAARSSVSVSVEPDGQADQLSTSRPSKASPKLSSSPSRRQKAKPGKAFSPCPRPQPGRRPLSFVRPTRQKRTSTPSPPPSLFLSDEEIEEEKADNTIVKATPTVDRVGAAKAKRGLRAGGPTLSDPPAEPSSSARLRAPVKPLDKPRKQKAVAEPVAGLVFAPTGDASSTVDAATSVKDGPAVKVVRPRAVYPYMAPTSTGRRRVDSRPTEKEPATSPLAERSRPAERLALSTVFPAAKTEADEPAIPIRIPTLFSRLSTPLAQPSFSASATPAPLGPTVRTTVSLAQMLRGRASMSATVERSTSPEKTLAIGDKKRKRSATVDDDKEDLGEVIQRLSKKARGPPTTAVSTSSTAATRSSPAGATILGSSDGRVLSTFKTHTLPLVKAESSTDPSAAQPFSSAVLPPYLAMPRWFLPPHSFYNALYPLPQRPVLGLQGWEKPIGIWPPGGGGTEPIPATATGANSTDSADADEVEFLREISFGGF